jgi:metal-responsive CopG/Arc/MetJ family transcriptional regulator
MKTAVSIPNDVFAAAERLAGRLGTSRSALYAAALRAFVARHDPEALRASIDAVIAAQGQAIAPGVREAGAAILRRLSWEA